MSGDDEEVHWSTACDTSKHTHHSRVLHLWEWEGAYHGNGSDNAGTRLFLKKKLLDPL